MQPTASPGRNTYFGIARDIQWLEPLPGERVGVRIRSRQTMGAYGFFEVEVAPMAGPPLHVHRDADEVLYVLDGELQFACGDRELQAVRGDMVVVPRGVRHAFRNFSDVPARLLAMFSPGGFEEFMVNMASRPLSDLPATATMFHADIVGPQLERLETAGAE